MIKPLFNAKSARAGRDDSYFLKEVSILHAIYLVQCIFLFTTGHFYFIIK